MAKPDELLKIEHQPTLEELENWLRAGRLFAQMNNGNFWQVRRNGKTKTWKREVTRWEIPCKVGLKVYFRVNNNTSMGFFRLKAE